MPKTYVTPRALLVGPNAKNAVEQGAAWPLCGTRAFAAVEVAIRGKVPQIFTRMQATLFDFSAYVTPFGAARPPYAGVNIMGPALIGILNVTPDSFADGGRYPDADAAIAHGIAMAEAGAAIIDVGGESTRPGAEPVSAADEIKRVIPVITALAARGLIVSVDTRHAATMAAAIKAGAKVVNDITALTGDPDALKVVADSDASVILMHMQGDPRTMQDNPTYKWAPADVFDFLKERVAACIDAGIPRERIAVDPGLGFGKTDIHNALILERITMLHGLQCAVVIGASRKGFIGRLSKGETAAERLPGSLAVALHAAQRGVQLLRVHDVAETAQALAVAAACGQ